MNILVVTPFFFPQTGGVTTYVEGLKRYFTSNGHRTYVLRTGDSDRIQRCRHSQDETVSEFYMREFRCAQAPVAGAIAFLIYLVPTLWKLTRFVKKHNVGLVSLEYPLPYMFYFMLLRGWTKIRVVAGLHGDDVRSVHLLAKHEQWIVKWIVRSSHCVLAHSSSLLSDAENIMGPLPVKRVHLPCWVDSAQLRGQAAGKPAGESRKSRPYILTVAKLYERKGLDVLLTAIAKIRNAVGSRRFVIAGDGPEEERLKKLASRLGIDDIVEFTGYVKPEDIPALVRDCEFFVLPSRSEPFGIVLLEAMVFGKAILATKVGGIPEFVIDRVNGLLVPSEDADALAAGIELLLENHELRGEIGKNGFTTVKTKYDYPALGPKYIQLFEAVMSAPRG